MHSHLLTTALTLLVLLHATALAAPASKRCMTPEQVTNFQAHWPKFGGHGPVIHPCADDEDDAGAAGNDRLALDVEALARRYVAALGGEAGIGKREAGAGVVQVQQRRCMTAAQIAAFQASWPVGAGRGPALVACPEKGEGKHGLVG